MLQQSPGSTLTFSTTPQLQQIFYIG